MQLPHSSWLSSSHQPLEHNSLGTVVCHEAQPPPAQGGCQKRHVVTPLLRHSMQAGQSRSQGKIQKLLSFGSHVWQNFYFALKLLLLHSGLKKPRVTINNSNRDKKINPRWQHKLSHITFLHNFGETLLLLVRLLLYAVFLNMGQSYRIVRHGGEK